MPRSSACLSLFVLMLAAGLCWSQESRGSITGKVTDPQSAVIPGASVVITNTETNLTSRTVTNETGYFEVSLLNPGTYSLSAGAPGFKKLVQTGVVLNVAGRLNLTLQLEVGGVTESVEVLATAALLDTTTASGGRVIDKREIMELPVGDMNPFALSAMSPGMTATGLPEERRAFDIGGTSSFRTMGGVGSNEYTIDGAPATGSNKRVGFVPPPDAVEEFKLETTPFDASYGHFSGAVINLMTKAGTNSYHGSLYEQHWQQRWNATRHFSRLAWEDAVRSGKKKASDPKQDSGRSNIFGGSLGGPVSVPGLYKGKDKFFFLLSYNGIYTKRQETEAGQVNRTVPKTAWRQGDFSDLLAADAVKYTIYDPRSARQEGSRVVRTPFPANKGIPTLNPVYKSYEPLYPKPNDVPGLVTREGINNYFASGMPKGWEFNQLVNRYDYNIAERHRVFGNWYWSHAHENAYDWTYEIMRGLHDDGQRRINKGGGGSYVWTVSNTLLLDIGASWTRFNEGQQRPIQTAYTPSQVGLPAYIDAKADQWHTLPAMSIGGQSSIGGSYPSIHTRASTGELKVQLTSVMGSHSVRYGWQERRYWRTTTGPGYPSGQFSFDSYYTRLADNTTTASNLGLSWAAFMMGLPSSIIIDTNDTGYWSAPYRAFYVHDDWRLTPKLQLNLGLRYEREAGIVERFNRGFAGGFLFDYKPPFADLAGAAYAKNALPELPASQFQVRGGTEYLGVTTKTYTNGTHQLLPRFGMAYTIGAKTVLRGGYGWYFDSLNPNSMHRNDVPSQDGYSQTTSTVLSNDLGLTICCGVGSVANLAATRNPMIDPFPVRADDTRFDVPYGNSLGPLIRQGRGWTFVPRDFRPAWQQRWRFGIQREITKDMVLDVSYNGAYSKIPVTQRIDYLSEQYWAKGTTRNQAIDDDLNRAVPNPFNIKNLAPLATSDPKAYRYLSTLGFFTGTTIRKHQLLRAFPNINALNGLRPGVDFKDACGGNRYHSMELRLERRFSRGLQAAVLYTYASGKTQDYYYNEFDPAPSWRPNNDLRPHRLVWSGIWELPFGAGRAWVHSGPMGRLAGGWQLSWVYQYQSGPSTGWSNRFFYGDLDRIQDLFRHQDVHSKDIHVWFDPSIAYRGAGSIPQGFQGFEGRAASQPGTYQVRGFPSRLDVLRADAFRQWDAKVQRRFQITERLRSSLSVDLLNVTNHTNFDAPNVNPTDSNFGRLTGQVGISRMIQFNLRIEF